MSGRSRAVALFGLIALLLLAVGLLQSWTLMLALLQLCLISAIMALGVNIQWGFAGLFNVGIMGFAALGGLASVLVTMPPTPGAAAAGGWNLGLTLLAIVATLVAAVLVHDHARPGLRRPLGAAVIAVGYVLMRLFLDPASRAIEALDPSATGYLGGLGLPVLLSWPVGGLFAAGAAWLVGRLTLGLRSDYLAIATLGISEIILAVLRNEDWLSRGVKNVTGIPRPLPDERTLQALPWVSDLAARFGADTITTASVLVRLGNALLFAAVLALLLVLAERALHSPWGRMMRAIRDNRDAAEAMGKDVTRRHLQAFVLGSAVVGIAGAMLVTLDGQFTPASYNPLRYTFLIWVMVIVGGSGNNWGAVLGGFLIWYVWVMAEPAGAFVTAQLGAVLPAGAQGWLSAATPHMRPLLMGLILLLTLRFAPRGLLPEARTRG